MNDVNHNSAAAGIDPGGREQLRNQQEQRVLTPVRQREDWPREVVGDQPLRRIAVIDTETTGLDWTRHWVIEICAAILLVDTNGRIAAIEGMGSGVEDPGHPLPPEIVELTGLTDAMVQGKEIMREKLTAFIAGCDGAIAFNSGFDRSFVEALLRGLPLMPWGCAMADVPWRRLQFQPGPQNYLLMQMGRFNADAHRARDDVLSLIELLDHVCRDGESVMAKVLAAMDGKAWRFEATYAPYHLKELLKDKRYRFRSEGRSGVWHKHVREADYDAELQWYVDTFGEQPTIVELPATERYRFERSWKPVERKARYLAEVQ